MKLTMDVIDGLTCPPETRNRLVFDDVQRGLAVRVTAGGSKTYLCQYTAGSARQRVPLGACNAISLKAARKAAEAIMGRVAMGEDPAAERKAAATAQKVREARDTFTLGVLIGDWERLHLSGKRPVYAAGAVRALRRGLVDYLDLPAADLDRKALVKTLDGMKGKIMAARTAAYGRACYGWAIKRGSLTVNPFMVLPVAATVKRDRVLTDEELAMVWKAAASTTTHGAIVRLLILTGQRREEVGGMSWDEVSPDLGTWTLPASRAKNGAVSVVPLSAPAQDLLRALPRHSDLVFPGRQGPFSGWSKCKERLDVAAGVTDWRLHDLRRTLATGLQRLGVRLEVTEAVLNHVSGSRAGIVGIYQRHDWAAEKRAALDAWGEHVMFAVEGRTAADNVVKLHA